MSGLDNSLIFDPFNLEVNLQREAIQFGRLSQSDGRVDLSVCSVLPASLTGHELEGAQKARWKQS